MSGNASGDESESDLSAAWGASDNEGIEQAIRGGGEEKHSGPSEASDVDMVGAWDEGPHDEAAESLALVAHGGVEEPAEDAELPLVPYVEDADDDQLRESIALARGPDEQLRLHYKFKRPTERTQAEHALLTTRMREMKALRARRHKEVKLFCACAQLVKEPVSGKRRRVSKNILKQFKIGRRNFKREFENVLATMGRLLPKREGGSGRIDPTYDLQIAFDESYRAVDTSRTHGVDASKRSFELNGDVSLAV